MTLVLSDGVTCVGRAGISYNANPDEPWVDLAMYTKPSFRNTAVFGFDLQFADSAAFSAWTRGEADASTTSSSLPDTLITYGVADDTNITRKLASMSVVSTDASTPHAVIEGAFEDGTTFEISGKLDGATCVLDASPVAADATEACAAMFCEHALDLWFASGIACR